MSKIIYFSKFPVTLQVFHVTKYTFALVNLKPIVNGHILVVPLRKVSRLKDLTNKESIDFMLTIQKIQQFMEYIYKADSFNIAIQDGIAAGQSVPHVHCHIIPRYFKDGYGDGIYELLEKNEGNMYHWLKNDVCQPMPIKKDSERIPRTMEVMQKEANWLKENLEKWEVEKDHKEMEDKEVEDEENK